MPAPVRIVFVAEGAAAVANATKTIAKSVQELGRLQAAEARRTVTISRQAANDNVKAATDGAKKAGAAESSWNKEGVKAAFASSKQRDKIRENSAKMAGQWAEREANAEIAASRRATAAISQEADKRKHKIEAQARSTTNVLGRGVRGGVGTVMGIGAGLGIAGGMGMISSAVTGSMALQKQAALLSNISAMPGFAPQDPAVLMARAQDIAKRTGMKSSDVMAGMHTVAEKAGGTEGLLKFLGDPLKGLMGDIEDLAKTAVASGTSMEDMGAVWAAASNSGVQAGEDMQQLMLDLVAMGKKGSIDFAQLATELAQMAGAGQLLEKSGSGMIRELVAMSQFAVKQKVGPEETRTSIIHMVEEFAMKSDVLEKSGVKTHGPGGKLLASPIEMLGNVMEAAYDPKRGIKFGKETKHDMGALMTLFGERGSATANMMTKVYMEGEAKYGKGGGKKAVVGELSAMRDESHMTKAQRDADLQNVMATASQKAAVAMENFDATIATLLPRIVELIEPMSKVMTGFANMAVWLAENPYKGIGAIIGASVVKELAGAALGKGVEKALTAALSAQGGGLMIGGAVAITAMAGITIAIMKDMAKDEAHGQELGKRTLAADIGVNRLRARMKEAAEGKGAPMTKEELGSIAEYVGAARNTAKERRAAKKEAEDTAWYDPTGGLVDVGAKKTEGGVTPEKVEADAAKLAEAVANAMKSVKLEVTVNGVPMSDPGNSDRNGKPPTSGATTRMGVSH